MDILKKMRQAFSSKSGKLFGQTEGGDITNEDESLNESYTVHVGARGARDEFVHEWWSLGQVTHRSNGPAKILTDRDTGFVLREEYRNFGHKHRINGPAIREVDPDTEVVVREEFYQNGILHNDKGATIILRDKITGEITTEKFYRDGVEFSANSLDMGPDEM